MPPATARPAADPAAWTYASGLVRALEGQLLTYQATVDLLASAGLADLLTRLRQTLLFAELEETDQPFELADRMDACYAAVVRQIAAACPDRAVADLFLRRIEWRAFRAWLRTQALGTAPRTVAGAIVPEAVWEQCWSGSQAEPAFAAFARAAAAIRGDMPRERRDQRLVAELTQLHEARDLAAIARRTGSARIAEWFVASLRLRLALALLRCRLNGWPHIRTADAVDDLGVAKDQILALVSPAHGEWRGVFARLGLPAALDVPDDGASPAPVLERLIDDAATERAREARGIPFGPEPVFAFLWALRTEAVNLRLVAVGLAAGLPRDAIVPDIRRSHV